MAIKNVEIKARCKNPDEIRSILRSLNATFIGKDHQVDTYYECSTGRLKLREGNIENALIYYNRPDDPNPKLS
ncbi:MAG: adenylate cyclase, partial [Flavobacteriales bacterium]|nr:adenylate cyclase [Flavobacteriales bacterium]